MRCEPPLTAMPLTRCTSLASTSSLCTISIGGCPLFVWTNSAGRPGSIHLEPNIAAADKPAITPRRRDHTQAASAR